MIEFRHDRFDSAQLGCEAYKLWLDEAAADPAELATELAARMDESGAGVVFCFAAHSAANIGALQQLGFRLVSIRQTYERALAASPQAPDAPAGVTLARLSDGLPTIWPDDLATLADTIGASSRYYKDPLIARERGRAVYMAWLSNSLFAGYADEVILAFQGDALIGLHTMRIKNGVGIVDLIGVDPAHQGAGLGGVLLLRGLAELHQRGVATVEVVTEGENVGASRFYQRNGFLLRSTELVWHKHIKDCMGGKPCPK